MELWKEGRTLSDIKSSVYWESPTAFKAGDSIPMQDQERRTRAARKHKGVTDTVRGTPAARSGTPRQLPEQHDAINNTGHPTRQRKNFSHLGNVCRHSTLGERKALWKKVAVDLKKLAKGETAYVSTHGSQRRALGARTTVDVCYAFDTRLLFCCV